MFNRIVQVASSLISRMAHASQPRPTASATPLQQKVGAGKRGIPVQPSGRRAELHVRQMLSAEKVKQENAGLDCDAALEKAIVESEKTYEKKFNGGLTGEAAIELACRQSKLMYYNGTLDAKAALKKAKELSNEGRLQEKDADLRKGLIISLASPAGFNKKGNADVYRKVRRGGASSSASSAGTAGLPEDLAAGTGTDGEVARMRHLNEHLQGWFGRNGIEVVDNSGGARQVDCLLQATLQHATANYTDAAAKSSRSPEAGPFDRLSELYRKQLPELGDGELFADSPGVAQFVQQVNKDFPHADMRIVVVQTNQSGLPHIVNEIGEGANPVVIWHKGVHYVALKSKQTAPEE